MAYSQDKPMVIHRIETERTWRKVRRPVAYPHPSPGPGFWTFVAGALFGAFLAPEIWAAGKKGREHLREVIEKKL